MAGSAAENHKKKQGACIIKNIWAKCMLVKKDIAVLPTIQKLNLKGFTDMAFNEIFLMIRFPFHYDTVMHHWSTILWM